MNKTSLYPVALALMLAFSNQNVHSATQAGDVAAIRYISGGVGEEDLQALDIEQDNHRLKMVFTTLDGTFLADIAVLVLDTKNNTLLDTRSEGPVMLLDLPSGNYQVRATYALETISKNIVSSPSRLNTVYFRFGKY